MRHRRVLRFHAWMKFSPRAAHDPHVTSRASLAR